LLKNLSALSEYAKVDQHQQNFEILNLNPGYDGMVKKTISRYCPYKPSVERERLEE
jgi:hypothetical protein